MLTQNKQSNNNPHARLYAQRLLSLSTPSIGLSFTLSIISFLIAATPWEKNLTDRDDGGRKWRLRLNGAKTGIRVVKRQSL